jgi:hypothetical protein
MKLSKSGLATLAASITFLVVAPAIEAAQAQVRGGGRASVSRGGGGGGGGHARGGGGGGRSHAASTARSRPSGGASARPSGGATRPSGGATRPAAGTRPAGGGAANRPAGGGAANRPAGGDRVNTGDRNSGNRVNTGDRNVDRSRDRETNIDRGDINIDNDIDIDGGDWDNGWDWDDNYHPIARGVAWGTAAAVTSAVVGSMIYSLPGGCSPYYTSYYYCNGVYYQPQYQGDTVVYVTVDDPAQTVVVQ